MKIPFFGSEKGGESLADYLQTILRNAIRLGREDAAAEPPLGSSKIGGLPHLPSGFEWPCYEAEDYEGETANRPLSFIAQIDLAAAARSDLDGLLPKSGYLYFFYDIVTQKWGFDPEDEGCARVYYFDAPADSLTVTPLPTELAPEARVPLSVISFETMNELPSYEEFCDLVDTARFGKDFDRDSYDETVGESIELLDCAPEEVCKLPGYADLVQGSMIDECARVTMGLYCGDAESYQKTTAEQKEAVAADAKNRILPAQFGTLSDEIMFGDCGCIYFYIRKDDLAARRFDRIWLCLQCG